MRLVASPAHENRLNRREAKWREADPQLPVVPTSPMERWYQAGNVYHWWSQCLHPPCNGWPSVGVKGVSSRRGEQSRIRELHRCGRFPQVKERERCSKSDGKAVEQSNDERRRRIKGIDGAKREGRSKFVNAEIARTAPRREFGTESQSCCERSKERHECFILHVRYVLKTCTRIVCVRRRMLCIFVCPSPPSLIVAMQRETALGVDRGMNSTSTRRKRTETREEVTYTRIP
ncbi:hypothetical protein K0M31_004628 [Melipona bicolor]|uniref:Uncharacterized protein n=1 Tax=Melipona bicolor TaxID=60889 RepID=A0AA40FXI1_9HYME|nr:hypothetical protein K0M31_004628 [Melipona bicolor]